MNIKIIIINLKDSHERRSEMMQQLKKVNIPYSFLEATEGKNLTNDWIELNVGEKLKDIYINKKHYSVNKNALACADSHRRAQEIASNFENGYTIILEDDVELASNFEDRIKSTIDQVELNSINIVFLGYGVFNGDLIRRKDMKKTKSGITFYKYPSNGRIAGAYAYMVNSIGAKNLLRDNIDKIQRTADTFYINENNLNMSTTLLYPKLVTTGYTYSDIGYPSKTDLKYKAKQRIFKLTKKSPFALSLVKFIKERRV